LPRIKVAYIDNSVQDAEYRWVARFCVVPELFAILGVQGNDAGAGSQVEDIVIDHREIALALTAVIVPEELAARAVERVDDVLHRG
jgi:hypothetical protein